MASTDLAADSVSAESMANEDAIAIGEKPVKASKGKRGKSQVEKKSTTDKGSEPSPA